MSDIESMAREAGAYFAKDDFGDVPEIETTLEQLERFAALIAARERERCAKACEEEADGEENAACPEARPGWWPDQVLYRAAEAIRALS